MRSTTAVSVAALLTAGLVIPVTASAHRNGLRHNYKHAYYEAKRELGARAPGRQIVAHGIVTKNGVRAATKHEIARSLRQLRRLLRPPAPMLVRTAVPPKQPPAGVATASVTGNSTLHAITQCESGGNYSTNTGNGFYGAYQFDQQTWQSVGGTGLPSNASPAEQDMRAAKLYAQRGSAPWPVCGR